MLQVEAIPTCGFKKSSSSKPTALNIALDGACSTPSTIFEEYFLFLLLIYLLSLKYFLKLMLLLVL